MLYYITIIPPLVNAFKSYLETTKELAEQLRRLNDSIQMEEDFKEANSDE